MPTPLVSVIMPIRNAAPFLDVAIRSIRAQSLSEFEFILVDDGSTDDSARIMGDHAASDSRISAVRLAHCGVARALNHALAVAQAPLVARMGADDEAKPERLERQVAFLDAHPEIAVLGTGGEVIDADDRHQGSFVIDTDPARIRSNLLCANCIVHPSVVMRREAVLAAGGYRPVFTASEDYDLWLRLSERHDLSNLPELLMRYRCHPDQLSGARTHLRILEVLAAQQCARLRRAGRQDPIGAYSRIDARTLRAIGLPRSAIDAALRGEQQPAPALPRRFLPRTLSNRRFNRISQASEQ